MLSKNNRLPRELFSELLISSKYVNSGAFSLRFSDKSNFGTPRIAVSVSKKISKSAVVRNRLRRQVYSLLRPLVPKLSPKAYLFVVKSGVEKLKKENLKLEVESLLKDAERFVLKA